MLIPLSLSFYWWLLARDFGPDYAAIPSCQSTLVETIATPAAAATAAGYEKGMLGNQE